MNLRMLAITIFLLLVVTVVTPLAVVTPLTVTGRRFNRIKLKP